MFSKRQKQFFERKACCSLSKKNSNYNSENTENQINEQSNNPIYSFNESKNKEQTKVVFSMQMKMFFQNHKQMRKSTNLIFNQSLDLN
jgi:hypothetical protein